MLDAPFLSFSFKQYSLQQLNNYTFVPTNIQRDKILLFMSYKCQQNTILIHSQRKSFTHKETLDSIYQSEVGLPHQIEKLIKTNI